MPLNERLRGPLAKNSDRGTSLPFVFLVGNHSSGKSSFVNYVLGRAVQTAGVAPTDDCFTVVAPGPADADRDGPALVGDPDMGFSGLRRFGPSLIHHACLKVRGDTRLSEGGFMMVDSPGMIDSPVSTGGTTSGYGGGGSYDAANGMDRGYDFQGVVRWFAERADVVLLFFDPDKPGTTGETLSVLLHSLGGMDHKLLIVLNKADQFKKIHDFARAYGSLCWNLSKVIPRKDLPRIYTMCLPTKNSGAGNGEGEDGMELREVHYGDDNDNNTEQINGAGGEASEPHALDQRALADLHQTRRDVLAEVTKAPKRRIDNVITHLHDSIKLLMMHALVAEDVRAKYSKLVWDFRLREGGTFAGGMGLAGLGLHLEMVPPQFAGGVAAMTVLATGGMRWYGGSVLQSEEERLLSHEELSAAFRRTHPREVSEADEFVASVWQRIRDPLKLSLEGTGGLGEFPSVGSGEVEELERILDEEIPRLRRLASPSHFGSKR